MIALGSEHIARDHCNFGVLEQQRCKLLSGHAEFLDVDEDIECTFRAATAQTIDLIDGFNCVIAASLVFFYHVVDFLFLLAECHNTGFLNERGRAGNDMLVKLVDSFYDVLIAGSVSEAPSGHGICLGEAV